MFSDGLCYLIDWFQYERSCCASCFVDRDGIEIWEYKLYSVTTYSLECHISDTVDRSRWCREEESAEFIIIWWIVNDRRVDRFELYALSDIETTTTYTEIAWCYTSRTVGRASDTIELNPCSLWSCDLNIWCITTTQREIVYRYTSTHDIEEISLADREAISAIFCTRREDDFIIIIKIKYLTKNAFISHCVEYGSSWWEAVASVHSVGVIEDELWSCYIIERSRECIDHGITNIKLIGQPLTSLCVASRAYSMVVFV